MNPVTSRAELEERIKQAEADFILIDKREEMPNGDGKWRVRQVKDILGHCLHQSAGSNTKNPKATANYHTSRNNHITPGRGLPSVVYHIMIPDTNEPAWLTTDILDRTYAQAGRDKSGYPGDENRHLVAVCVMGGFKGPGYRGRSSGPTAKQWHHICTITNWLAQTFGYGNEGVFGHYHFGKVACPGYEIQKYIERIRASVRNLSDRDWQRALLNWDGGCLPKYGADGAWGNESKYALYQFQKHQGLRRTAIQDPFTELLLRRDYLNV